MALVQTSRLIKAKPSRKEYSIEGLNSNSEIIKELKNLPMQPGGFLLALLLSWKIHLYVRVYQNSMDGLFNFIPFLIFVFKTNKNE